MEAAPGRMLLFVRGLEVSASVGIYPDERRAPQTLLIDAELEVDPPRADTISNTVDYDLVPRTADRLLSGRHFDLVEIIAMKLADALLEDQRVHRVRVCLTKPGAMPGAAVAGAVWSAGRG